VCSDLSPTDADADNVFNREAVGRQSMSEKRKAYMDARLMNFYQQAKTVRGTYTPARYSGYPIECFCDMFSVVWNLCMFCGE